jgi:hypothetical protein
LDPTDPVPPVKLRPQGFSPSRRFAPLTASRACSIPVPPMGFDPSRLCSSPGAVRSLERRAPQGFSSTKKEEAALSGTPTPNEAPTRDLGTSQMTGPNASLGFPAPRFPAVFREGRSHALASPLALSRLGRTLTAPLAPQGFSCRRRDPSLSRRANPLAVLHLVVLLDSLETPQGWVMGSPQRLTRVAASPSSSLPCCQVPGRSSPRSLYR